MLVPGGADINYHDALVAPLRSSGATVIDPGNI